MSDQKLMPGECIRPEEGAPVCNKDGELVRMDVKDETAPDPEMMEDDNDGIVTKVKGLWDKAP